MTRPGDKLHDPAHIGTLERALELAERAVERYYAISPREWESRFRYDLVSSALHPELPFHPGALAQIALVERGTGDRPPRYRIVLKDEELLALGDEVGDLQTVLAATLAHELVHLVRFASRRVPFDLAGPGILDEERIVRRITRESLEPVLPPGARRALERLTRG